MAGMPLWSASRFYTTHTMIVHGFVAQLEFSQLEFPPAELRGQEDRLMAELLSMPRTALPWAAPVTTSEVRGPQLSARHGSLQTCRGRFFATCCARFGPTAQELTARERDLLSEVRASCPGAQCARTLCGTRSRSYG